jgi:hypothetical protein
MRAIRFIEGQQRPLPSVWSSKHRCFGEYDGVVIFEAPDEGTAAASAIAAITPGHLKSIKTTLLLSAEQGVEAMRRAGEATFRGPGP